MRLLVAVDGHLVRTPDNKYWCKTIYSYDFFGRYLNVFDDVYLLKKDIDVEQTKLQVEELTDIKYVYYEYLEKIFRDGDKDYVPFTEEHEKLFNILKDRNMEVI